MRALSGPPPEGCRTLGMNAPTQHFGGIASPPRFYVKTSSPSVRRPAGGGLGRALECLLGRE
eukprot:14071863-Alexandrium_andersonii.AAC.1